MSNKILPYHTIPYRVHQWPVGDAPPAYAITRGPDEKIGWHTLLLKSGPR